MKEEFCGGKAGVEAIFDKSFGSRRLGCDVKNGKWIEKIKKKKKDLFSFYVRLQSVLFSILFVHYFCWLAFYRS